jgi:hypothetical protein
MSSSQNFFVNSTSPSNDERNLHEKAMHSIVMHTQDNRLEDVRSIAGAIDVPRAVHRFENSSDNNINIHKPRTLPDEFVFTCGQLCAWLCRCLCVPGIVYINRNHLEPRYALNTAAEYIEDIDDSYSHRPHRMESTRRQQSSNNLPPAQVQEERAVVAVVTDDDEYEDDVNDSSEDENEDLRRHSDASARIENNFLPRNSTAPEDSAVDGYSDSDSELEVDDRSLAQYGNMRIVSAASARRNYISIGENNGSEERGQRQEPSKNKLMTLDAHLMDVDRFIAKKQGLRDRIAARESKNKKTRTVENERNTLLKGNSSASESDADEHSISVLDRMEMILHWLEEMKRELEKVKVEVNKCSVNTEEFDQFVDDVSNMLDDKMFTSFQQGKIEELPGIPRYF